MEENNKHVKIEETPKKNDNTTTQQTDRQRPYSADGGDKESTADVLRHTGHVMAGEGQESGKTAGRDAGSHHGKANHTEEGVGSAVDMVNGGIIQGMNTERVRSGEMVLTGEQAEKVRKTMLGFMKKIEESEIKDHVTN